MTRRSITGEREGTYSILNLVENVVVESVVETRARNILEILLLRSDIRRAFDALNDADPATMKAISDWITGLLSSYRRTDVDLTMNDFPTLSGILGNYRPLIYNQFDSVQLLFGPNYEDLGTKITNLEVVAGRPDSGRWPNVNGFLDRVTARESLVANLAVCRKIVGEPYDLS